ncbi:hypothetical protein ACLB2K_072239 [Fragaria x ananassa]
MEVSNQFKQVFEVMDANGDGKISPVELSEVLCCLGYKNKSAAAKEAEGMVREMDCNGDGFIDLDEFMTAVRVLTTQSVVVTMGVMISWLLFLYLILIRTGKFQPRS